MKMLESPFMKFETIRWMDRYVGIPFCFLFTVWRHLIGDRFKKLKEKKNAPQKILFLKLIEQGSTVLMVDALKRATEKFGVENVYFWVFEENRPIIELLEVLPKENILSVRLGPLFYFLFDIIKSLKKIRRLKMDIVIDCEFFARAPALLSYLTGATIRVGLHRFGAEAPYRGDLMTHRVQYNAYIHTAYFFRLLFEAAFENPKELPLLKKPSDGKPLTQSRIKITEEEKNVVLKKLFNKSKQKNPKPIILLNANCSDMIPLRKWDSVRYLELAQKILKEIPQSLIVFTGAPSEKEPIEKLSVQLASPRAISMAGETTLRELLVLYTLSDLLITNDSGPSHFSSLTNIATLTLFGPETPLLYAPLGEKKSFVSANLRCSPCVSVYNHRFSPCQNNLCMQNISVEQVWRAAKEILQVQT